MRPGSLGCGRCGSALAAGRRPDGLSAAGCSATPGCSPPGPASWHLVDGALPAPVPPGWQGIDQAWELVEVELHQKARPRVVAALKTRPPHTARVTYYVPDPLHAPLSALLASVVRELGGRPQVAVEMLPQVPGVTYMTSGGAAR